MSLIMLCKSSFQLVSKFRFPSIYFLYLFLLAPMSSLAISDNADFSGNYGGAVVSENVYTFPSTAESWAGFSNQNSDLYPLQFSEEGSITFNGSVPSGGDVTVRFKLERLPHPNTEPSYSSESVAVSGSEVAPYTVVIPSQGDNNFSSLIFYVETQDEAVAITDVVVNGETVTVDEPVGPTVLAVGDVIDFESDVIVASFGGTNGTLEVDGDGNTVLTTVKGNGAQTYAGNTVGKGDFVFPLTATDSVMSANVYSTVAVPVRMKFENSANGNQNASIIIDHSGSGWETLTFDFAGTNAIDANFDTLVLAPNYGNSGAGNTYQFDDIVFVDGSSSDPVDPVDPVDEPVGPTVLSVGDVIDFETDVIVESFGGANATFDVDGNGNVFLSVVKSAGAQTYAGSTIGKGDFVFPLTATDSVMSANVYSTVAVPVRMKVENSADGNQNASITVEHSGSGWETLTFDFAGTNAIDANFDTLALFPNYGNSGVGNTYQVDDIKFEGGASSDPVAPVDTSLLDFSGTFGGATYDVETSTFTFPSGAESWAGFSNLNKDGLYPISFSEAGSITFTGSVPSGEDVNVRFKLEYKPNPETEPSYSTGTFTVSGAEAASYTVEIPSQGNNTFSSIILYVNERDIPVVLTNIDVNSDAVAVDPCFFGSDVITVEAESYSGFVGDIDSQSTTDTCGSENMAWIDAGDSMTYPVNIPSAGNYAIGYRVASEHGSSPGFELYVDDVIVDAQGVDATGGWQSWITIQGRVIALDAGDHSIKWNAASNGININWFTLTPTDADADDAPVVSDPEPAVSFTVTTSGSVVKMHSSAFGWNPANALIATDNGDGTWTATIDPGPLVDIKYKWIVDDVQEDLSTTYRAGNCTNDSISAVDDTWFNRLWTYGSGDVTGDVPSACSGDASVDPVDPVVLSVGDVIDFETDITIVSFGGASGSLDVDDNGNTVLATVKSSSSETWAGNTLGKGDLIFPLTVTDSVMSVNVYSTVAVPVRMKFENSADGNQNASITVDHSGSGWETLTFDFAGTNAIDANFDTLVLAPNYGNSGAGNTYQFDDIVFVDGSSSDPVDPVDPVDEPVGPTVLSVGDVIDFETDITIVSFDGANGSLEVDANSNTVLSIVKAAGAKTWAGNSVGKGDFVYPLTATDSVMSANVYSTVAVPVRMKVENSADGNQNASITVEHSGSGWETLTFDFAGTNAIDANFDTLVLFPNYGNSGAGNTYQFDDITFALADDSGSSDLDNDGVNDDQDAFPNDASETADSDNDGVGDNADAFPNDASETADSDNDGVGDNADYAPNDPSVTEAPAQPDQLVSVKGDPSASIGRSVDVVIEYNVSDNNATLSGLGVRVHYDSSSLTFTGFADVLAADNISSDGPFNDDEDLDGNPATDKYVSGAWASLFANWPGELPAELLTLSFNVADPVTGDTTPIGFSSVSNAAGYDFAPTAYDMPFSSGSWDFDEDGKADALTDGLMLLRYTFNLRDAALTSGAISSDSTLTAAEVEANVAEAASSFADIDGSGEVDALTDGLLLLRYLFHLRDDALVAGAIASGAERSTSADVEAYIISLMP